ncbi:murein hydrolase activator EnvC family protein [Stappia indica]|uniref:murein hydrolase activator EnvC family protein n=1 Tax=Stappia indica TaxID=538381 RepID=UPI001CD76E7C|nr:peptidoglycan DD-metalloendopeptidase family protein [Stappia indica]MCA1299818.1 peptidoglycan DD-metalloendopeptidase family protein [Stappia indica]
MPAQAVEQEPARTDADGTSARAAKDAATSGKASAAQEMKGGKDPLADRKAQREEELSALTRDLSLSADRQAAIAREIRAIDRDRQALNTDLLRTAQRVTQLEEQLAATESRLRRLGENEDAVRASLADRQDVLAEVLSALQRIGQRPPPALAVRPKDALGAVRSALLLNAVMPDLHIEAQALASDLAELRKLKLSSAAERDRLVADTGRLNEERHRVELLVASKRREQERSQAELEQEQARSEELAQKAKSLEDLISSLENEIVSAREAAEAARKAALARASGKTRDQDPFKDPGRLAPAMAFASAKGRLTAPVSGTLLRDFGADDGFGGRSQGRSIATRARAQVVSPADGWVVYAGPFRSYGEVLILNAGDGYHILLAGMDRIRVQQGQFVLAGEPVAAMGDTRIASAATIDLSAPQPVLYVEFRKDGISIDSSPWWSRPEDEKVRG